MPLHHLAMRWALRSPAMTSVIIGARTVAQLDDTLDALHAPALPVELLEDIDLIAPAS